MTVTLREPNGTNSVLDNIESLKERVLQPNSAYWGSGSGDLGMYVDGGENPILILAFSDQANGFFVQLYPKPGPEDWMVAINPDAAKGHHEVYIGGEPMSIPEDAFITPQHTWEAVQHFFNTGEQFNGVPWKSYWDLDWPEPAE
jgi:hypothetical protein